MKITALKGVKIFREYYMDMIIKPGRIPSVARLPVDFTCNSVFWKKAPGDKIEKFDIIAEHKDGIPVYSPFSGTYRGFSVGPRLGSFESMQYAEIDTDSVNKPFYPLWDINNIDMSRNELAILVRKAAIADELRKRFLYSLLENGKDYKSLLIDCVDDEPYDLSKTAVYLGYEKEVVAGADIIANALNIQNKKILLMKNFVTEKCFKNKPDGYDIVKVCGKYPAFPVIKQFSSNNDAIRVGAKSCRAVYRAAVFGEPQISHTVTVWGDGVTNPANIEVINGTPVSDIIEQCGANGIIERVVAGGIMTGYSASLSYPVYNWDGVINVLVVKKHHQSGVCINCGRCAIVCPKGLAPYYTLRPTNHKGESRAKVICGEMCVHCGACSYICPARIPLDEYIRKYSGNVKGGIC